MNIFKLIKSLFVSAPRRSPAECTAWLHSGAAVLVDVREPREWVEGVAQGATLFALSDLTGGRAQWGPFLAAHDGRELLVYCRSGGRSAIAARVLTVEGHRAVNVGGLSDWAAADWPIVKPSEARR